MGPDYLSGRLKFPCVTTDTRAVAHNKFQHAHL